MNTLSSQSSPVKRLIDALQRKGISLKRYRSGTLEITNPKRLTPTDKKRIDRMLDGLLAALELPQERAAFTTTRKVVLELKLRPTPVSEAFAVARCYSRRSK
jgi:hypothetical protein